MDAMELRTISVFCGLDVGKGEHHATALDRDGHRLHDRPLPQDEQALRALFDKLNAHGLTCFSSNVAFRGFDQSTPGGSGRWLWI